MRALLQAETVSDDGKEHPLLQTDATLAQRTLISEKDLRKSLTKLLADRMVEQYSTRLEEKAAIGELVSKELTAENTKCYWFLNFNIMADSVKYKETMIMRALDDEKSEANALQGMGYACDACHATMGWDEIAQAAATTSGDVPCPRCGAAHLAEVDNSEQLESLKARHSIA